MYQMVRFRKFLKAALMVLLALLLLSGVGWGGWWLFDRSYLLMDGQLYRRDLTELDLSGSQVEQVHRICELSELEKLDLRNTGLTAESYEELRAALPDCTILWEPCFQGRYYPQDTQSITVSTLTEADVAYLDYFPQLKTVDAMECRDYDAIMLLAQRRPECQVRYQVGIGQREYLQDATFLRLPDANIEEVSSLLQYLPQVESVLLTGQLPTPEEIAALAQKFPEISVDYQVDFHGFTLASDTVEADISGLPLESAAEIEAILPYLPMLKVLTVCECPIPAEEMAGLADAYPGIRFTWTVNLGGVEIRTDVTEFDISGNYVGDAALVDQVLPYFPNLTKAVMCGCGIGNEEMDALNRKYEDIQIVWSVYLGDEMLVRTDITTFMPVKQNIWMEDNDTYNLRYCTELIAIDMGHMDIRSLEFAAYMPHLKYLLVCDSQVNDLEPLRGLQELMYLEIFLTDVTDYSPLLECPALEDLNMSWTYGSSEPIAKMTWLKRLWWGGKGHSYYDHNLLTSSLPDTTLVLYDGESTGSGWRKHPHYYEMRDLFGMYYME